RKPPASAGGFFFSRTYTPCPCRQPKGYRPPVTPVRGGAVWQLVGLITRRSQVQILPPLPSFARKRRPRRVAVLRWDWGFVIGDWGFVIRNSAGRVRPGIAGKVAGDA